VSDFIHYRGYVGKVEFSEDDSVFHGKVVGIRSLITFEGDSVTTLVEDFRKAIDDYYAFCSEKGIKPEQAFKGSFNVRVNPTLHRNAALKASATGITLNAFVENAIAAALT